MRVYIAGPMRHRAYYNFPEFDRARDRLRKQGHVVVSPADLDRVEGFDALTLPPDTDWSVVPATLSLETVVRRDVNALLDCEAVYMLAGWQESVGATAERALALWMKKPVFENGMILSEVHKS